MTPGQGEASVRDRIAIRNDNGNIIWVRTSFHAYLYLVASHDNDSSSEIELSSV